MSRRISTTSVRSGRQRGCTSCGKLMFTADSTVVYNGRKKLFLCVDCSHRLKNCIGGKK